MDNQVFIIDFVDKFLNSNTVAVVIGALIAGWFGFKQYRSQKTWENINKRYFEDGIENLITHLHNIRKANEDCYSDSFIALQYLRKLSKKDFEVWSKSINIGNRNILVNMPKSFFIIKRIFENNNFNKLYKDVLKDNIIVSDSFISQIPLILKENNNDSGLLRDKVLLEAEALNRKSVKEYRRVHKKTLLTIGVLEEILFRLRKMNIDSYK
ncbi:MAG: hypothetical protein KAQ64_03465, partial [Candidatus Pacebacteria bacterium]|nr:hypothetical protein [Candidatus Paceibacterota bacterium]